MDVSLYTPLFAGVIWDAIDVPLEDIEQIEVMRGPGAVMWGPNAMNGVINIITRNARTTTGLLTSMATGNELKGTRHGPLGRGAERQVWAYRIWTKEDYTTGILHTWIFSGGQPLPFGRTLGGELGSDGGAYWFSGRRAAGREGLMADAGRLIQIRRDRIPPSVRDFFRNAVEQVARRNELCVEAMCKRTGPTLRPLGMKAPCNCPMHGT